MHNLAHPGIRATRRLISSRYVWPGLASQVAAWCRDCQQCQRAKVTSQPASPPGLIANPIQRFSHIHIHLVGPLPASRKGFTHLFTAVDRSTHWAEAIRLRSTSAACCAEALIGGWVARFGVPEHITSDRGRQFCSSVWDALTHQLGVKMRFTTPYHPQSNGVVERFHRRLKDALRARSADTDWYQHLPWVLLGLRAAPRKDSGISAAEPVYGCPLSLPGQFLSAAELSPGSFVSQLQSSLPCVADRTGCSPPPAPPLPALCSASLVYVRSPPLSRQGARNQVFRGGHRRLPNGGLRRPPQASSREIPDLSGSGPSPWPASFAAQALSLLRLSPVTRLGGGNVEAVNTAPSTGGNPPD